MGLADSDIDLQSRDAEPDIGADERLDPIFADGFETGDASAWSSVVGWGPPQGTPACRATACGYLPRVW